MRRLATLLACSLLLVGWYCAIKIFIQYWKG
jgi:hypothetical protein